MKLFTRISFILSLVIVFYCDYHIYNTTEPSSSLIGQIFGYLGSSFLFFILCYMLCIMIALLKFNSSADSAYSEIISEDIKLIYKQIKLIIKFYLNL